MDTIHQAYFRWLTRASDCLFTLCGKSSGEVWQDDWHFGWHQSWVVGCTPYEAAEDAYMELRDRGLLEIETGVLIVHGS